MFGNLFSGWHIVILVALVLLLFGATKLPALAKGIGESLRILRKETRGSQPPDDGGTQPAAAEHDAAKTDGDGTPPPADPPQGG